MLKAEDVMAQAERMVADELIKSAVPIAFAPQSLKVPAWSPKKLLDMYKEMNTRLSAALMDHKWDEHLDEMPITASAYCRPCM